MGKILKDAVSAKAKAGTKEAITTKPIAAITVLLRFEFFAINLVMMVFNSYPPLPFLGEDLEERLFG